MPASHTVRLFPVCAAAAALAGVAAGALSRPSTVPPRASVGTQEAKAAPEREDPARLDGFLRAATAEAQLAAALSFQTLDTVGEIRALLQNRTRFPDNAAGDAAVAALLGRWLELDARGALDYGLARLPGQLSALLQSWSLRLPAEAAAWVLAMPPAETKARLWTELCVAEGKRNPAQAWEMLARTTHLTPNTEYYHTAKSIALLVSGNVEGAISAMAGMPPALTATAAECIARTLAKTDPDRAWRWALAAPNAPRAIVAAFGETLRTDPAKALALWSALPAGERPTALMTQSGQWRVENAEAFASLLGDSTALTSAEKREFAASVFQGNGLEGAQAMLPFLEDEALPKLIRDRLRRHPADAPGVLAGWRDALPAGPARTAVEQALADRATFAETPSAEPAKPKTFAEEIQKNQGGYIATNDVRLGRLTVDELDPVMAAHDETKDPTSSGGFLAKLATTNPATAAAWLERAPFDNTTGARAAQFSSAWAGDDPAAAAKWVTALPDGGLARAAAENVSRQYFRYDPAAATAWADSLPPSQARDAAKSALLPR